MIVSIVDHRLLLVGIFFWTPLFLSSGGRSISMTQAPYQASYGDICGAVIVHRRWALTSAHCGSDGSFIRVGSKYRLRGPKVAIKRHLVHPKYGKQHTFDYDIQLLFYRRLHFSELVNAIYIGDGKFMLVDGGTVLRKSNFQGDYNDRLQQVKLQIVPMNDCQAVNNTWYNHTLTSRMFCAGGEGVDACQGDSGGAAVSFGRLAGLSSFGFGCGRRIPGVYTDVTESSVRKWIQQYTGV